MLIPLRPKPANPAALLALANTWTALNTFGANGIGATSTSRIALTNTTAAAAGAQQWSPSIVWTGQGWKTNATAASQQVDWRSELVPVQGAANPSSKLAFSRQVNSGGFAEKVAFVEEGVRVGPNSAFFKYGYEFHDGTDSWGLGARADTELYLITKNQWGILLNEVDVQIHRSAVFGWSTGFIGQGGSVLQLHCGGSNILEQREATSAQTQRLFGNYVSSTDYHRSGYSVAKQTLSGVSGATVTATTLIPDGAVVIGVTTKVTTALGATGGTTGYKIGDGADDDRWGEATTITLGTSTDNTNATATTVSLFTAANNVVLTAVGGNFDGTGVIMVCVFYLRAECD